VFENRVLRGIFGPKRDEGTGWWKELHNELHNLYGSEIIRVIKSRRIKWAGVYTVVCVGKGTTWNALTQMGGC
jgi:hypothetical protein